MDITPLASAGAELCAWRLPVTVTVTGND